MRAVLGFTHASPAGAQPFKLAADAGGFAAAGSAGAAAAGPGAQGQAQAQGADKGPEASSKSDKKQRKAAASADGPEQPSATGVGAAGADGAEAAAGPAADAAEGGAAPESSKAKVKQQQQQGAGGSFSFSFQVGHTDVVWCRGRRGEGAHHVCNAASGCVFAADVPAQPMPVGRITMWLSHTYTHVRSEGLIRRRHRMHACMHA